MDNKTIKFLLLIMVAMWVTCISIFIKVEVCSDAIIAMHNEFNETINYLDNHEVEIQTETVAP